MNASSFAWLVPLSLATFAIAFAALRANGTGSWWWSSMFACGAAAFASSIFPATEGSYAKPLLEDGLFLGAFVSLAAGIAKRSRRSSRLEIILPIAAVSLGGAALGLYGFQSVRIELLSVQSGIVLLLLVVAAMMYGRARHGADRLIFALILLSAVVIMAQNAALILIEDPTLTLASWNVSNWALALQASGATIGVFLAIAIFLAIGRDVVDDLRRLAESDPLTGALNRRGFDEQCAAVVAARRKDEPVALILIDIDHFKRINDRFGHWAGDSVLCAMASLLKAIAGPRAKVGRLGGEEFAVLLPGDDLTTARSKAETIRTAFATTRWPDPIGATVVTASFGVTDFGERETLPTAAERADRLLYVAKNHGRDQVCFCSHASTIITPDPAGIGASSKVARLTDRSRVA